MADRYVCTPVLYKNIFLVIIQTHFILFLQLLPLVELTLVQIINPLP